MTFLKMTILNVKSVIVRFSLFQTEDKLCEYALIYMEIIFFHINSYTHITCIGTKYELCIMQQMSVFYISILDVMSYIVCRVSYMCTYIVKSNLLQP